MDEEPAAPTAALGDALDHTIMLAMQAGQVQRDCGLDILPEDFVKGTLKFGLVEVSNAGGIRKPALDCRSLSKYLSIRHLVPCDSM